MHENMYPLLKKNDKFKENTTFRMIDFMSKQPVKLTGFGFFTFNNEEFNNVGQYTRFIKKKIIIDGTN